MWFVVKNVSILGSSLSPSPFLPRRKPSFLVLVCFWGIVVAVVPVVLNICGVSPIFTLVGILLPVCILALLVVVSGVSPIVFGLIVLLSVYNITLFHHIVAALFFIVIALVFLPDGVVSIVRIAIVVIF